jgi:glycosyltransferase involved in cell wall biosynthesis
MANGMDLRPEAAAEADRESVRRRVPTVLQVIPRLETGGAERGTLDVAAGIKAAGGTALVASAGGRMVRELERSGALHVPMPVASKNPLVMRRNVTRLAELARRFGAELIHARSRAPAWSARAAARRLGLPFVTTFHAPYNARTALKRAYNSVMASGDRVIAISEFVADHVARVYPEAAGRIVTIPRGIDPRRFDPDAVSDERVIKLSRDWMVPDAAHVIMLPGRLTRWKGQTVLIDALARLDRRDVVCLMVGDDQGRHGYRTELEALIRARRLEGIVRLVGECTDMPAAYALANVVVSASTDPEGFGRVPAEAQAMGKPVIATDHGGARETVLDGQTGWLIRPGDPDALAETLGLALDLDLDLRARVAEAGRRHVLENFTVELMVSRTLDLYRDVVEEHARRAGARARR